MTGYTVALTKDWQFEGFASSVRQFTATVEWVGPGAWLASWPESHTVARRMFDDCAAGEDPSRWGVVVKPKGSQAVSFAGVLQTLSYSYGENDGYAPDTIIASGYSDMGILNGEYSTPVPSTDSSSTGLSAWPVYVDGGWPDAESAILELIRDNLGAQAVSRRQLDALSIPGTQNRGGPITYKRRFPTLLEAVRDICLLSGLTVRVDRVPGGLAVVVGEQVQNTAVSWSRRKRTLKGAVVTYRAATATSALAMGSRTNQDDPLSRLFTRRDQVPPAGGFAFPRARTVDTSGDTLAELREAADKALIEGAQAASVVVNPNTSVPYIPGVHYRVGDLTAVDASPPPVLRPEPALPPEPVPAGFGLAPFGTSSFGG